MNYAERMQRRDPVKHQDTWQDTGQTLLGIPIMALDPPTEEQERENAATRIADSN